MAVTYDDTLPTPLDRIRKEVGDTDTSSGGANAMNQDEEINALVMRYGEAEALAHTAESMAATFAAEPDHFAVVGGITVTWGERAATLLTIAKSARQNAGIINDPTGVSQVVSVDAIVYPHDPYSYYPPASRVRP